MNSVTLQYSGLLDPTDEMTSMTATFTDGEIIVTVPLLTWLSMGGNPSMKVVLASGNDIDADEHYEESTQFLSDAQVEELDLADTKRDTYVRDLPFSPRGKGSLHNAGYVTVGDVLDADEAELLSISGVGQRTIQKIREFAGA